MLLGNLYLAEDINFVRTVLSDPMSRTICMSMDEADDTLEREFPNLVQKSTILCPPPSAIYKEVDGDSEGFINDYLYYLGSPSVMDFFAAMLYYMHTGGNVLIYIPEYTEDSIWVNILCNFMSSNFGIIAGSSAEKSYYYNSEYDYNVLMILYDYGYMSIFEFIASYPYQVLEPDMKFVGVYDKVMTELKPFSTKEGPSELFYRLRTNILNGSSPILKPALLPIIDNQRRF